MGVGQAGAGTARLMRSETLRGHAKSRNGYGRMAKTVASGIGFTNTMLEELGLLSQKSMWNELVPIRRTG